MTIFERLFPRSANNDYGGSKVALYAFPILLTVFMGRSLIHFLKSDAGLNSIATIHVFPVGEIDPNQVIYLFGSLWGSQQIITAAIGFIIFWRYRNLIPMMLGFILIESALRIGSGMLHPLTADYYASPPPGRMLGLPGLVVFGSLFALSLRPAREKKAATDLPQPAPS